MSASSRRGTRRRAWRQAARLSAVWMTPALLLAVPARLVAEGRDGLWVALLFLLAPLFAALVASRRSRPSETGPSALVLLAMLLVAGLLLWANLSLAGDVATWLGVARWRGILPVAFALALSLWAPLFRPWPWLVPLGLVALLVSVAAVVVESGADPIAIWGRVASQPAFRFPSDSPWVTEGRRVGHRPGVWALVFEEEHRVTPVDSGALRVEVSDRGRLQVQEWTLEAGQSLTLRPGDRLRLDAPVRLKFEAGKRVPGAPVSGIAWADSSPLLRPLSLERFLGLAVTLVGGAMALVGFVRPAATAGVGAGLGGLVLLVALGWAECWAIYSAWSVPEVFLGGVSAATLVELPALALRGEPWGPWLVGLTLAGLFALFLTGSAALREQLGASERGVGEATGPDRGLWCGLFALAALAALWPVEPWWLIRTALGLGASTVAPLVLIGAPPGRPRAGAVGLGLLLFLGLTGLGQIGVSVGAPAQAIFAYPALAAAPVVSAILWVALRTGRP